MTELFIDRFATGCGLTSIRGLVFRTVGIAAAGLATGKPFVEL
jgi:hypothetical protein